MEANGAVMDASSAAAGKPIIGIALRASNTTTTPLPIAITPWCITVRVNLDPGLLFVNCMCVSEIILSLLCVSSPSTIVLI